MSVFGLEWWVFFIFYFFFKVSADTTKKRINSLTMELMEARNTLDVKNQV